MVYQPPAFREDRLEVQHALIRAHPLGLLITSGADGLTANPIPFLVDPDAGPHGTLRAHLARANPQLCDLAAACAAGAECLVVFQGPQHYVTPSWYASKAEHGRVVPTWNYATVHAWGVPAVFDDAPWLRRQIGELTDSREAPRAHPWAVEDAPADFVTAQVRGIVGVAIPIARIEGKWKMSQNRSPADRAGVVAGLTEAGAADVARLVPEG
jgi:transcriptional regulator